MFQNNGEFPDEELDKAPFNAAIDTLKDLSATLKEIRLIDSNPNLSDDLRQTIKIKHTRYFFMRASPLIKKDTVKKYKDEVMNLQPVKVAYYRNDSGSDAKFMGFKLTDNFELDKRLNEILMDIQMALQDEGFFMPPREDEGL